MTVGWIVLVARVEVVRGSHETFEETIIATVLKGSSAIPLIFISGMLTVTILDILGGFIVVTKRFLEDKFLNPYLERKAKEREAEAERRRAQARAEGEAQGRAEGEAQGRAEGEAQGRAQGREEGRAQGRAQGREEADAEWAAWYNRMVIARANNEPFDEPPPSHRNGAGQNADMADSGDSE